MRIKLQNTKKGQSSTIYITLHKTDEAEKIVPLPHNKNYKDAVNSTSDKFSFVPRSCTVKK